MAHRVTLIPGDGIGPEVTDAVLRIIKSAAVPPIDWEPHDAGIISFKKQGESLPHTLLDSIKKNKVALKGPLTTPIGTGFSVNVALRKELDLYANVRPVRTCRGSQPRFEDVDLVIVRENTEDLYAGLEHMVGE